MAVLSQKSMLKERVSVILALLGRGISGTERP